MASVLFPESIIGTTYGTGYQLYFYEVGTTTDLTVYSDFALTTAHTQPVEADADGKFAAVYLDATGNDPKVVLHDADDVEVWTLARYPIEDITTLSSDLDTAETAIDTLEGNDAVQDADIDTLEGDVAQLQTESLDYESRIAALEAAPASTAPVALAFFIGENNPVFLQSSGFSGVAKNGTGEFDLTFTTPRENANYIVLLGLGPSPQDFPLDCVITNKANTGFRVETWYTTGGSTRAKIDRDVNVAVYDLD